MLVRLLFAFLLWTTPALAFEAGQDTRTQNGLVDATCTAHSAEVAGSLMCSDGRSGGQVLQGGTAAGEDLTLESTTNATKGDIFCLDDVTVDKGLTVNENGGDDDTRIEGQNAVNLVLVDASGDQVILTGLSATSPTHDPLVVDQGRVVLINDPNQGARRSLKLSLQHGSVAQIFDRVLTTKEPSLQILGGGNGNKAALLTLFQSDINDTNVNQAIGEIHFVATRGDQATWPTTPVAVDDLDFLGRLRAYGDNGTDFSLAGAQIGFSVDEVLEAVAATVMPVKIQLATREQAPIQLYVDVGALGQSPITGNQKGVEIGGDAIVRHRATGTVTHRFTDLDTVDDETNAELRVNCTATGTGLTEDCDMSMCVEEDGALDCRVVIDADAGVTVGSTGTNLVTIQTDGTGAGEVVITGLATGGASQCVQSNTSGAVSTTGANCIPSGTNEDDIANWNDTSGQWETCTPSSDFVFAGGPCTLNISSTFTEAGACVGDVSTELCSDTKFGTNNVNMGNVPSYLFPDAAQQTCHDDTECPSDYTCEGGTCDTESTNDGQLCGEDSDCTGSCTGACTCNNAVCTPNRDTGGDGGSAMRLNTTTESIDVGLAVGKAGSIALGAPVMVVGGRDRAENFVYNGQTSGCSGDTCRGGVCGGGPSCTLTANSDLTRSTYVAADTALTTAIVDVYDFNLTGGLLWTVPTLGSVGSVLWIRAAHNVLINAEDGAASISMAAWGGKPHDNQSTIGTAGPAGGTGGFTMYARGGIDQDPLDADAGVAGGHALLTGMDCGASPNGWVTPPVLGMWLPIGGGGGAVGATTNVPAVNLSEHPLPVTGGAGGGGPGCTVSATGTPGDGGRGGGGIIIEAGNRYECIGATLTTAGAAGGTGGSGGGAGNIWIFAKEFGTDSCTYTTTGGAAGATFNSPNCGAGAAGGNGCTGKWLVPF